MAQVARSSRPKNRLPTAGWRQTVTRAVTAMFALTIAMTTSPSRGATITGGEIEVLLHSSQQFGAAGLGLDLIGPTMPGSVFPKLVFPIVGGDTATGVIHLGGGVVFTDGTTNLVVTNFVVDVVAGTTTVNTSIDGGPNLTLVRSNNFNCAAEPGRCLDVDRMTPLDDPAYSGLVFSEDARARLMAAFPAATIDFDAMLPDVSRVTSLQVVPLPGALVLLTTCAAALGWRRAPPTPMGSPDGVRSSIDNCSGARGRAQ